MVPVFGNCDNGPKQPRSGLVEEDGASIFDRNVGVSRKTPGGVLDSMDPIAFLGSRVVVALRRQGCWLAAIVQSQRVPMLG